MIKLRIGALMKERNISEAEMWKRTKVARNSIRAMMRNANTRIDLPALEKIARELGVNPLELFEVTDEVRGPLALALLAA